VVLVVNLTDLHRMPLLLFSDLTQPPPPATAAAVPTAAFAGLEALDYRTGLLARYGCCVGDLLLL